MNDRIAELIKQADYNAPGGKWKEYFAELLITECLNIVGHYNDVDEGIAVAKKNFGVK